MNENKTGSSTHEQVSRNSHILMDTTNYEKSVAVSTQYQYPVPSIQKPSTVFSM